MSIEAWLFVGGLVAVGGLVGVWLGGLRGQPVGGLFAGAILGPFGWLLTLLSRDLRLRCGHCQAPLPISRRDVARGARLSRCWRCGEEISVDPEEARYLRERDLADAAERERRHPGTPLR